jgi:hypothetical protein
MYLFSGCTVSPVSLEIPMMESKKYSFGELHWQTESPSGLSFPLPYFLSETENWPADR